jgi:transcriptional regulator with XRE-family HTH domain
MGMTIKELREELKLTHQGFAERLGLKSKGYAYEIENGAQPSVTVALEIERLSEGRIDAAELNPDVALVRTANLNANTTPSSLKDKAA